MTYADVCTKSTGFYHTFSNSRHSHMGGLGRGMDGTGVLDTGGMVGLETGMVVLEIGVPDTGGTGGLDTGMVVLEIGKVGAGRAGSTVLVVGGGQV